MPTRNVQQKSEIQWTPRVVLLRCRWLSKVNTRWWMLETIIRWSADECELILGWQPGSSSSSYRRRIINVILTTRDIGKRKERFFFSVSESVLFFLFFFFLCSSSWSRNCCLARWTAHIQAMPPLEHKNKKIDEGKKRMAPDPLMALFVAVAFFLSFSIVQIKKFDASLFLSVSFLSSSSSSVVLSHMALLPHSRLPASPSISFFLFNST